MLAGRIRLPHWLRRNGLLVVILIAVTLLALPVLTYPLGRDQGEFATIGRGLLTGRIPYTEIWNPKPPAVFYVYALAMTLFGRSTEALRAIDLLMVPLISAGLYWIGGRVADGRVGLWAALIFPVFYFTETFWTLTQNDGIVLLPMTLAVVVALKTLEHRESAPRRALLWAALAGGLSAYVIWFKYPFALFAVGLIGGYLLAGSPRPAWSRRGASIGLAYAGTALAVMGAGAGYLAALGALPDLILSAQVTAQYTALTFNLTDFAQLMGIALGYRWAHWGLLWLLAPLGWFLRRPEPRSTLWWLALAWLLAGTAIMLVQAKGYDYHWLPMLPPLALLAANSLNRILQILTKFLADILSASSKLMDKVFSTGAALLLLGILAAGIWPNAWPYLTGQEDQLAYYRRFQAGEFVADESLQIARLLRERVVPGNSLFIWGFRPEVYYLSQLNPATRFIFQFPLVGEWYPAAWREETVDTLWAALPPYVLVLQADYMPWVTGRHEDSNTLLQEYTELNNWLMFNYERETQIGSFFLWRRKP